jgi:hypothetical protein
MSGDSVKATKTQTKFENNKLTFKTGYVFDVTSLFPDFPTMNDGQKYVVVYGLKQAGQDFTATEPGEGWTKTTWQSHKLDKLAKGESPSTRKASTKEPSMTRQSFLGAMVAMAKTLGLDASNRAIKPLIGTQLTIDEYTWVLTQAGIAPVADEDPTAE